MRAVCRAGEGMCSESEDVQCIEGYHKCIEGMSLSTLGVVQCIRRKSLVHWRCSLHHCAYEKFHIKRETLWEKEVKLEQYLTCCRN